jgi:hypothetical protein
MIVEKKIFTFKWEGKKKGVVWHTAAKRLSDDDGVSILTSDLNNERSG